MSLLIANCYQYQASQPERQAALLALVDSVIDRWSPQTDHVILGGDWNASLRPRIGYCGAPHTVLADERLLRWSEAAGLRCAAPEVPTWTSCNEQRHAVLDCFFWKSRSGGAAAVSAAMAFSSPDPRHDHRGVRITLQMDGMAAMPPVESLWRPLRLKMQCWERKREDWQKEVGRVLAAPGAAEMPSDLFARLDQLKRVALACAQRVLGESGGGSLRATLRKCGPSQAPQSGGSFMLEGTASQGCRPVPCESFGMLEFILTQQTSAPSPYPGHPPIGSGPKTGSACCDTSRSRGRKSCTLCDG